MPIFGKLIFALDFSRLLKAILLNLQNGMRIQDALDVSKSVIKNYVLLSVIETSINNVLMGSSWIEPIEKSGLASPMIVEMLKIGMQSDLTEMMEKLVEYMDIDIKQITCTLHSSLYGKFLILSIWSIKNNKKSLEFSNDFFGEKIDLEE